MTPYAEISATLLLVICGVWFSTPLTARAWTDWYVSTNDIAVSDGSSWATAFTNVQDALEHVAPDVTNVIYLAGHTFDLTHAVTWIGQTNVLIRGGYEGISGEPGNHDPAQWSTVLRQTVSGQRVLHMVDLVDCRLEYVTITGGYINDHGGGCYLINSTVTMADCIISNNQVFGTARGAHRYGGGIYVNGGAVEVLSSRIENNIATAPSEYYQRLYGGGLYLAAGALDVENSSITSNQVLGDGTGTQQTYGGGATHASGTALTLRNCLIDGNATYGATVITGNNQGSLDAGGVRLNNGGLIENCTIAGNQQGNDELEGAGLRINGGAVTNTIVWGNLRGPDYDEVNDLGFGTGPTEADNVFYSCAPELTNGLNHNLNDDPLFIDADAGDFRLQSRYGQYTPTGDLLHHAQTSPAMDAGTNQSWMIDALDLQGFPRIMRGFPRRSGLVMVDMGAYEVNAPPPGTMLMFH